MKRIWRVQATHDPKKSENFVSITAFTDKYKININKVRSSVARHGEFIWANWSDGNIYRCFWETIKRKE